MNTQDKKIVQYTTIKNIGLELTKNHEKRRALQKKLEELETRDAFLIRRLADAKYDIREIDREQELENARMSAEMNDDLAPEDLEYLQHIEDQAQPTPQERRFDADFNEICEDYPPEDNPESRQHQEEQEAYERKHIIRNEEFDPY